MISHDVYVRSDYLKCKNHSAESTTKMHGYVVISGLYGVDQSTFFLDGIIRGKNTSTDTALCYAQN